MSPTKHVQIYSNIRSKPKQPQIEVQEENNHPIRCRSGLEKTRLQAAVDRWIDSGF